MKMSDLNLVITVILSQVWVIMGWVRVWHKGKVLEGFNLVLLSGYVSLCSPNIRTFDG